MRCQSVMHPSTAEYWHIGAMMMRLASDSPPARSGVKRWGVAIEALPLHRSGRQRTRDACATRAIPAEHGTRPSLRSDPSADLLRQLDDDSLRAADVAEPVDVLVVLQLADELTAAGSQPGNDRVDVLDGE